MGHCVYVRLQGHKLKHPPSLLCLSPWNERARPPPPPPKPHPEKVVVEESLLSNTHGPDTEEGRALLPLCYPPSLSPFAVGRAYRRNSALATSEGGGKEPGRILEECCFDSVSRHYLPGSGGKKFCRNDADLTH